jgi:hypothetical protein
VISEGPKRSSVSSNAANLVPREIVSRAYPTREFDSFTAILDAFVRDIRRAITVDAAAVGVRGPIVDQHANLTNIEWDVSVAEIARRLETSRVGLLNDLEAMAYSVAVLTGAEIVTLQRGERKKNGNAAVIAAGTGSDKPTFTSSTAVCCRSRPRRARRFRAAHRSRDRAYKDAAQPVRPRRGRAGAQRSWSGEHPSLHA